VGNINFPLPLDGRTKVGAKTLRKRLTDAERLLWTYLRAKQLEGLKFRRQEPIGKYIADFACHEKRIAIEVDGGQHSTNKERDRDPPLNPLPSREGKVVCDTLIKGWESTHLK
jgi:very-short-patch-repair endonuclease